MNHLEQINKYLETKEVYTGSDIGKISLGVLIFLVINMHLFYIAIR